MIYEKKLETWSAFEDEAKRLNDQNADTLIGMMGLPYIYRGQSDAAWRLETTLERLIEPNHSIRNYYNTIKNLQRKIESFTERKWILPSTEEYDTWLENPDSSIYEIPALEYMAYLRHYGFPSPLLDWSLSPHVAAYFAFRDIASKADSVAIFMYYMQFGLDEKLSQEPKIFRLEEDIRTDRRHYLQQSVYTICCNGGSKDVDDVEPYYANHEDLYAQTTSDEPGEYVTKYILPASERAKALLSLETHNINAYSLIGTEESLLETEFIRYYALRKARKETYPDWSGSTWE